MLAGLILLLFSSSACQTRCFSDFDCGDLSFCTAAGRCETECFTDKDCTHPPECEANPAACQCKGLRCNPYGACIGQCFGGFRQPSIRPMTDDIPTVIEGWERPPGEGHAFIMKTLAIAGEGRGFDLDKRCRGQGNGDCIDNSLWELGELGNASIRQGLLNGETLLLVELSGIDEEFLGGTDKNLTLKLYAARDADQPIRSSNNFSIPDGATKCCEFKISEQSLRGNPRQAIARAPARIITGELESLGSVYIRIAISIGSPPYPQLDLRRLFIKGRVASDFSSMNDGILGAGLPIQSLALTDNPYCQTLNTLCPQTLPDSSLLDLIAALLPPDLDLDGDGIERVLTGANGRIAQCYDGCGLNCTDFGSQIPPFSVNEPHTCALQAEIQDGYSVAFAFDAVQAYVVGIGQ
jgi:hypothetical protein